MLKKFSCNIWMGNSLKIWNFQWNLRKCLWFLFQSFLNYMLVFNDNLCLNLTVNHSLVSIIIKVIKNLYIPICNVLAYRLNLFCLYLVAILLQKSMILSKHKHINLIISLDRYANWHSGIEDNISYYLPLFTLLSYYWTQWNYSLGRLAAATSVALL